MLPDGSSRALTFEPMSGTVPANGFLPIHVTFTRHEGCQLQRRRNAKRKPTRLTLNVKGEGYGIHEVMEMEPVSTTTAPRPKLWSPRRVRTSATSDRFSYASR